MNIFRVAFIYRKWNEKREIDKSAVFLCLQNSAFQMSNKIGFFESFASSQNKFGRKKNVWFNLIVHYANVGEFLILKTVFWAGRQHCPIDEKKYHKNEWHLCLAMHIFAKFS